MKLNNSILLLLVGGCMACNSESGNLPNPEPEVPGTPDVEVESGFDNSKYSISSVPVTANASKEARNLYAFLKENFGKKIISGAMANINWNFDEANWIFEKTGKYPAINCMDYMHHIYSGESWINYEDTKDAEFWWEKKNGLIAAMWHWNVPANEPVDAQGKKQYAFYYGKEANQTQFDPSKIKDQNSEEYKIMIDDMDQIAGYLKLFQNKNIPVIWRPLHEAAGNTNSYPGGTAWFWWGSKGPEACIELWQIMYDRFVNHHQLNNLIWVWTSEGNDPDWYPGDEYVDIIACDIYVEKEQHASQLEKFKKLTALTQGKKIVALSECGGIPDPDECYKDGAMWSWFMPWYNEHTRDDKYNGEAYFKKLMSNKHVITRDQMPNLK